MKLLSGLLLIFPVLVQANNSASLSEAGFIFKKLLSCRHSTMRLLNESVDCTQKLFSSELEPSEVERFTTMIYLSNEYSPLSLCPAGEAGLVKAYERSKYAAFHCFKINRNLANSKNGIIFFTREKSGLRISKIKL